MRLKQLIAGIMVFAMAAAFVPQVSMAADMAGESGTESMAAADMETAAEQTEAESESGTAKTVAAFDEEEIVIYTEKGTLAQLEAQLPKTVGVHLSDGSQEDMTVSWYCLSDYEDSSEAYYLFEMNLPEGYQLAEGMTDLDQPYISVYIQEKAMETTETKDIETEAAETETEETELIGDSYVFDGETFVLGDGTARAQTGTIDYTYWAIHAGAGFGDIFNDGRALDHVGIIMLKVGSKWKVAYCVHHNANLQGGHDYVDTESYLTNTEKKRLTGRAIYYGFHGFKDWNPDKGTEPSDKEKGQYTATQVMIWLVEHGMYSYSNYNFTLTSNAIAIAKKICAKSDQSPAGSSYTYFESIYKGMQNYEKMPSFSNREEASAPTQGLRYNSTNGTYSVTLTDTNGVIGSCTITGLPDGVTSSVSGNQLTLTSPSSFSLTAIRFTKEIFKDWTAMLVWSDKDDASYQQIATYESPDMGSISSWLKVKAEPAVGSLKLSKVSTAGGYPDASGSYSLQGAVYTVYTDAACTQAYGTMTTDASGNATLDNVAPGTYYVKETTASKGFALDMKTYTVKVSAGSTASFTSKEIPYISLIGIKKWADNDNKAGYRPDEIKLYVYSGTDSNNKTKTDQYVTLNAGNSWTAAISQLPATTSDGETIYYALREDDVPKYYTASLNTVNNKDGTYTVTATNTLQEGYLQLIKSSSEPSITDGNSCYSLADAEYTVYADSDCRTSVGVLKTDAAGKSNTLKLPPDTYYVKETKAAVGYELDAAVYTVNVTAEATENVPVALSVSDQPSFAEGKIEISKRINGEETEQCPSLAGTQFTVKYYDGRYETEAELPKEAARTWVLQVLKEEDGSYQLRFDEAHKVSGDDFYMDHGKIVLPLGTITIQETKPAAGYTLEGYMEDARGNKVSTGSSLYITQITKESDIVSVKGGNVFTAYDTPMNGSVKIVKYDTDGHTPLAGVSFVLKKPDGTVVGEGVSDKEGIVTFMDLYPGKYILTETATVPGHTLLADDIEISIPMCMTEEEIQAQSIDKDKCVYSEREDIYYIYDFTYEISNGVTLSLPTTGGFDTIWTWLPMLFGLMLIGGAGYVMLGSKRFL